MPAPRPETRPRRAGLRSVGLRWRLTAFVAATLLTSAALVFVVVYVSTGSQLRSQADRDLSGDVEQLTIAMRPYAARPLPVAAAAAERYVSAEPYSAASTLLFVLIPGAAPICSQPSAIAAAGGISKVGLEVGLGSRTSDYLSRHMPGVGELRIFERRMPIAGRMSIVAVAEPLAFVTRAQHGIERAFVLAAALSLVLALVAAWVAGARVTAPLRRMAAVATRVDGGDLEPRMEHLGAGGPEVAVLADAFNHMLERLAVAFAGQRDFLADASHELRTPLTVIRGQIEVLADTASPSAEEVARVEAVVQAEIARMNRLVEDLMLLTKAEQDDFLRLEPVELPEFVEALWSGLSVTADRRFEVGAMPPGGLVADADRLAQALRNLGSNAIAHTEPGPGLVRIEADALPGGRLRFAVLDNGPGIPVGARERVFERLYRTDAARSRAIGGSGLGLAIVRAIAAAHGGSVEALAGPGGVGTRVEIVLPRFVASPERGLAGLRDALGAGSQAR